MSWTLIKSIQKDTDLRLIMPFGLNLKLGDIISVSRRDGSFTLEGTSASILEVPVGGVRPPQQAGVDLLRQSGKSVSLQFRAQGKASTLFPELPNANAGFDIKFDSADSWLLAVVNRQISALDDLDRFRRAILSSYAWGVWKADWVLVTSVATVDRITLIAASTGSTNVAVSVNGEFDPAAPVELKLTAGVSVVATNHEIIQSIVSEPSSAFCSGLRVQASWWKDPTVGTLKTIHKEATAKDRDQIVADALAAPGTKFWEDADSFS